MKSNMKRFWVILFFSYSICSIAQADYYYYKGDKIPIIKDEKKVCVSIPKTEEGTTKRVLETTKVLDNIHDEYFNIYVISQTDLAKLNSLDSWEEDSKSVITTPVYRTVSENEVYSTPYINVCLKTEEDINLLTTYAEEHGLKIIGNDPIMPLWYILSTTKKCDKNALQCANALSETGYFKASVPDLSSNDWRSSIDPMFNQQWGLQNNYYPGIDISACSAWGYATGKGIKLAIVDEGIDVHNFDLAPNISSLSYDTETSSSPSRLYGDHGTHCAGIAGAVKDNNIQIAGVAPEVSIMPISNRLEQTTNSRMKRARGICWAYQHGADIISNSWNTDVYHPAIDDAIQDAFTYGRSGKGCVIVFSTGNESVGVVRYPANCNEKILTVGAIGKNGNRAPYSCYGTQLDIVAPGDSILSILPNNQTDVWSGTSMACPHVSGVAALILERNSELSVDEVNSIICRNAKKIPGVNFNVSKPEGSWDSEYGYGLVDAYSSLISTSNKVYLQKETFSGSRYVSADSIYVGHDVTNTKEHGGVVFNQSNTTMRTRYLKIKDSTYIRLGSTLRLQIKDF